MKGRATFYLFLAGLLLFGFQHTCAQDTGFIYGKVTTIDDDIYTGAIRWGNEEVYWTDLFNAAKEKNTNLDYLTEDQVDELEDRKASWSSKSTWMWASWSGSESGGSNDFLHQFVCQFGELKRVIPTRRQGAEVEMQNGDTYELSGEGYNDISTPVQVADNELGKIQLDWSRIASIEFMKTPSRLETAFGKPLYGTVTSGTGMFTGYVQWDHDERVDTDVLDGNTEDGDLSIAFENIASIERYGSSRSIVILKSGRELTLRGSNDVNDENRGIIVTVEGLGRVDIPWDEFEKVTFTEAKNSGPDYGRFSRQEKLSGTVSTKAGESFKGDLVFDLDERYNFEIIQGLDDQVEYLIPFKNIAAITPKNYDYSSITLKNGEEYLLGKSQDVSDRNQGVLVMQGGNTNYIEYTEISRIDFR